MKFKKFLEEGFAHIKSILKVYKSLSRNVQPDEIDLWMALKDMKEYYEDYINWNIKYGSDAIKNDPIHRKIHREYKLRLKEINNALKTKSNMLVTLDKAINQLHYDYPVIYHIGLEVEELDNPKAEKDYKELVDTLELLLKKQGKNLPFSGYSQSRPVRIVKS